jgi:cytochrome b561
VEKLRARRAAGIECPVFLASLPGRIRGTGFPVSAGTIYAVKGTREGQKREVLRCPCAKENAMKYDRVTRWLHAGFALGVLVQLTTSELMQVPKPGSPFLEPGHRIFELHRWSGISVVSLIVLHWLWQLTGHVTGGWGHLFPWFSASRLRALASDLKEVPTWFRGGLPGLQEETIPLAGAVHGLGLAVVSCMALTGATIWFGMGPDGSMSRAVATVREVHMYAGGFLWLYFLGHVGIAVLHQLRGDRLITNMFNPVRK